MNLKVSLKTKIEALQTIQNTNVTQRMHRALPIKKETYQNVGLKIPHPFRLQGPAGWRRQMQEQMRGPPPPHVFFSYEVPVSNFETFRRSYIYLLHGLSSPEFSEDLGSCGPSLHLVVNNQPTNLIGEKKIVDVGLVLRTGQQAKWGERESDVIRGDPGQFFLIQMPFLL